MKPTMKLKKKEKSGISHIKKCRREMVIGEKMFKTKRPAIIRMSASVPLSHPVDVEYHYHA